MTLLQIRMVIFLNVTKFHVDNLKGSKDISNLRGELQSIDGVHAVRVDDVANTVTVEYEDNLSTSRLTDTINKFKNVRQ